ncbi:Glycosyltransferase [Melia azedarach]|uniref:Glycosyltransferase n=1 Tax=Melia azedarach TaxID=155640 RepID=A0ACC1YM26_MELAZ|nr:Glycosyltransferase [Melia azedarach]
MAHRKENIVMFPFMAQGHIIPFLALALQLENTNKYTITFVNTPLNIKKLKSSLPPDSSIHLLEIPFNSIDHNLPPCTENTDSVPYHLIPDLLNASLSFKSHFRKLITDLIREQDEHKPLAIITGMYYGWCQEIAQELGVFHAIFIGGGGFGFACYYSLWLNLPHRNTDSDEFVLPDFPEASRIHVTQTAEHLRNADGSDSFSVFLKKVLPLWSNADGILVNTVEEFDNIGLTYFRRKLSRPVWPIGPVLLSTGSKAGSGKEFGISAEVCRNWLDSKPLNSVLYVSFGSQNTIAASQMIQLATALEASGKNFIWVVRPPIGFDINSDFKADKWMPEGFERRIKDSGRGLVIHKWAPQIEILSHKSVSAFLSHCGWNSVLESLSHGVPLIAWPLAAEQFYNSKLLEEEIQVCVEVARGKSCEVLHKEIAEKINLVMNETEKGKEMRRKASEVREIIEDAVKNEEKYQGSSVKSMEQFLNVAFMMRENKMNEV